MDEKKQEQSAEKKTTKVSAKEKALLEENAELKKRLAVAKQSKSPKSTQSTKKR